MKKETFADFLLRKDWLKFQPLIVPAEVFESTLGSKRKTIFYCEKCGFPSSYGVRALMRREVFTCPICSGRKIISGFNDTATLTPQIAKCFVGDPNKTSVFSNEKASFCCGKCSKVFTSTKRNLLVTYKDIDDIVMCPDCARTTSSRLNALKKKESKTQGRFTSSKLIEMFPVLKPYIKDKELEYTSKFQKAEFYHFSDDIGYHTWIEKVSNFVDRKKCPYCYEGYTVRENFVEKRISAYHKLKSNGRLSMWDDARSPFSFAYASKQKVAWKCDKGHKWTAEVFAMTRKGDDSPSKGCGVCAASLLPNSPSKFEKEVLDYVLSLVGDCSVVSSDRRAIYPKELDIYIPSKSLAIECNGLYWHSDAIRPDSNNHFSKWDLCKRSGIKLVTVWEDDWLGKNDIVKSMIARKLGASNEKKVSARKCRIEPISNDLYYSFLEKNHIQGGRNSSIRFALSFENEIVAVVGFSRRKGNTYCIDRYATSCNVQGGFSKLLKYFERHYLPSSVFTFSDNEVSDGTLYKNNGFVENAVLSADYKYIYKSKRVHKSNFRKLRFKKDDNLKYESGLTEFELAKLNKINKVYDSGKIKWVKTFDA